MDKVNKYLNESKEAQVIRDWAKNQSRTGGRGLRDAYYSVAENIEKFANELNILVGDTGDFSNDLKNAVKARDAFRKITLGKYV